MYEFIIKGETPSKKNSRIVLKNGLNIPSKKYREWHETAVAQLLLQKRPEKPIESPVVILLEFVHGDLRRRDSDNGTSSIFDTLTDAGILADDNWQIVKQFTTKNTYSKNNPECRITILDD